MKLQSPRCFSFFHCVALEDEVRLQSAHVVARTASPLPCRAFRHHTNERLGAGSKQKIISSSCPPSQPLHSLRLPSMAGETTPEHVAAETESQQLERTQIDRSRIMDVSNRLTGFWDMPVEIKEKIYEYTLRNEEQFEAPLQLAPCDGLDQYPPSQICFPNLPNMCYINKAERSIELESPVISLRLGWEWDAIT
jgi:hypothetical protein